MKTMQNDLYDEFAAILLPKLLLIVDKHKAKVYPTSAEALKTIADMTALLNAWKHSTKGYDSAALVYNMWYAEIVHALLHKQLPEHNLRQAVLESSYAQHFVGSLITQWERGSELDSDVCDSERAPGTSEACAILVVVTLYRARERIVARLGTNEVVARVIG